MAMKTMMNERCPIYNDFSCLSRRVTTEFKTSLKKKKLSTWMLLYCHKIVYVLCNMYTVWYPGKNQHPLFYSVLQSGKCDFLLYNGVEFSNLFSCLHWFFVFVISFLLFDLTCSNQLSSGKEPREWSIPHIKIWKIFVIEHILLEHNCSCLWKCISLRAYISE